MRKITHTKGYSLIEVLVSIAILLIAMVGPMTIAAQGIKSAAFALEQNTASFLAQEGIEAAFALRNGYALNDYKTVGVTDSWSWVDGITGCGTTISSGGSCSFGVHFDESAIVFTSDLCSADPALCLLYVDEANNASVYTHVVSSGNETPFTRVITATFIDDYVVEIVSEVTWQSSVFAGVTQDVKATTVLFDLVP
jgi:prepilin-type N-terminal cleavage/methylation domain-containing protein